VKLKGTKSGFMPHLETQRDDTWLNSGKGVPMISHKALWLKDKLKLRLNTNKTVSP